VSVLQTYRTIEAAFAYIYHIRQSRQKLKNMSDKIKDEEKHTVTVTVNNNPVVFQSNKALGSVIKSTAIAQGVQIQQDFNLFEKVGNSSNLKPIGDSEEVTLHPNQKFRAVAPDDNSQHQ
jgi:hypothetical protein